VSGAAAVARLMAPLVARVRLSIARGVLNLVDDARKLQEAQVTLLADEVRDKVERFQDYGFTSVPLAGAEVIVVSVGGNRNHAVAIAIDDRRYRKKDLQPGEVAIYTDEGDSIVLKRGRKIEVLAGTELQVTAPLVTVKASTKVRMETPLLEVTGDIEDRCDDDGRTMDGMREIYNMHVHPENDGGGPTDEPAEQMWWRMRSARCR
jgi:phage baseplate assembly protein V